MHKELVDSAGQALSHRHAMCWQSQVKQTGQVGEGGGKRGTGAHNGRKGVGTQGICYARLMMRESEGEEAVHA